MYSLNPSNIFCNLISKKTGKINLPDKNEVVSTKAFVNHASILNHGCVSNYIKELKTQVRYFVTHLMTRTRETF